MTRRFDPNTNPFADDLLRLSMTPATRFSWQERYVFALILAGKLYELKFFPRERPYLMWPAMHVDEKSGDLVVVDVLFDSDLPGRSIWLKDYIFPEDRKLIVLSVGVKGVVELFNGSVDSSTHQTILSAIELMVVGESTPIEQERNGIPPRSDEQVRRDYVGEDTKDRGPDALSNGGGDDNRRGGGGGRGGDPGGGGEGGNGGFGAGGTGELLNHPVLFAIDRDTFDAILELT